MPNKIAPQIFEATVRNIKDLGNDTKHFELFYDPGKTMDFIPGQFVSVYYPEPAGKVVRRAYSIASSPNVKDHVDLCLKLIPTGTMTPWFWTFKGDERIKVQGPLGKFFLPDSIDFDIVFVATGTGIAPFRSMVETLLPDGFKGKIWVLFGARYDNAIPYHEGWLDLEKKYPNFTYIPTISRPRPEWKGETGYVQTKIEKFFSDSTGKQVYICGLNDMIQAVLEACLKVGFPKEKVIFERYD